MQMDAFSYASDWSDESSVSDVSIDYNDEDEGDEEKTLWTLQMEESNKPDSRAESNCVRLKSGRQINLNGMVGPTCSGFSVDGNWLAVGTLHGCVQIFAVKDGRLAFTLDVVKFGLKRWPCTALCIRPSEPSDCFYNVLLTCDLSGQIHYWHMTSGMHLGFSKEVGNSIYTADFHPAGVKYATAGSDCKVRVYDASSCSLSQTLRGGNGTSTAGHNNRVFAVKWHSENDNVVCSGGWDNTIQIWDLREGHSVRSIYGPRICGEAIDFKPDQNLVLSGSWRRTKQLQEWDFGSGRLLRDFQWPASNDQFCRVYAAKYGRGEMEGMVLAGGSGSHETCFFSLQNGKMIAKFNEDGEANHSLSLSADGTLLSVVGIKTVNLIDMKEQQVECLEVFKDLFKALPSNIKPLRAEELNKADTKVNSLQAGARVFKNTPMTTKMRLPRSRMSVKEGIKQVSKSPQQDTPAKVPSKSTQREISKQDAIRTHRRS